MSKLAGKFALVTGASKGIGAGIARELTAVGAAVNYATDRAGAEAVVDAITKANGRAIAVQGDVAKSADVTRLFAEVKKGFGVFDNVIDTYR